MCSSDVELRFQDTTSNPRWTGEKATLSSQDGRAAQFLRKFDFGGAQGAKVEK